MEGYDLITSDDSNLGPIVEASGGHAVVEHGHLRKSRHAVPPVFLDVHDDERVVRTTLSKQVIEDSPKLENGDLDEDEIAAYYGLTDTSTPDGEGLNPGVAAAEAERARTMRNMEGGEMYGAPGRPIIPPDSHQ